jgi:hypothetical protein
LSNPAGRNASEAARAKRLRRTDSLASFQGKPICIEHPEADQWIGPDNWQQVQRRLA